METVIRCCIADLHVKHRKERNTEGLHVRLEGRPKMRHVERVYYLWYPMAYSMVHGISDSALVRDTLIHTYLGIPIDLDSSRSTSLLLLPPSLFAHGPFRLQDDTGTNCAHRILPLQALQALHHSLANHFFSSGFKSFN